MKTDSLSLVCTVQSITDHVGRRTLKFSRCGPDTDLAPIPANFSRSPFRLKMQVEPETAFQPVIQVRSHANS
ncbi:MAG: hypothetical protein WCS42_06060 [Verrucomicrobiota bacterium]